MCAFFWVAGVLPRRCARSFFELALVLCVCLQIMLQEKLSSFIFRLFHASKLSSRFFCKWIRLGFILLLLNIRPCSILNHLGLDPDCLTDLSPNLALYFFLYFVDILSESEFAHQSPPFLAFILEWINPKIFFFSLLILFLFLFCLKIDFIKLDV